MYGGMHAGLRASMRAYVRACLRACLRAYVRSCVRACVCAVCLPACLAGWLAGCLSVCPLSLSVSVSLSLSLSLCHRASVGVSLCAGARDIRDNLNSYENQPPLKALQTPTKAINRKPQSLFSKSARTPVGLAGASLASWLKIVSSLWPAGLRFYGV